MVRVRWTVVHLFSAKIRENAFGIARIFLNQAVHLRNWRAWMGVEKDLPPGEKLVACFRPFLEGLVASDLSPKTIQKHVDNLWALGGEIIRDLHANPSLRRKSIEQILGDRIDDEGGSLLYAMESEEDQQRSFDATCKKLYRFLSQSPR